MKKLLYAFLGVLLIASVCLATDVTLRWDANTESDLAGYDLSYKIDTPGSPYNGTGAYQGPSPIDIPLSTLVDENNPEYTITELNAGSIYFFVLRAYDTADNYSGYSNEVMTFYISNPSTNGFVVNSSNYTTFPVSGRAAANIPVRIYSNNVEVGSVSPDSEGAWAVDIDFTGHTQGPITIEARTNTPTTLLTSNSLDGTLNYSAPNPPTITHSLVIDSVTQTTVTMSWADVPQAKGYIVFRNNSEIDRTSNNQYTDTGLQPATTYEYKVSTEDAPDVPSNIQSATTKSEGSSPPSGGGGSSGGGCFINSIK